MEDGDYVCDVTYPLLLKGSGMGVVVGAHPPKNQDRHKYVSCKNNRLPYEYKRELETSHNNRNAKKAPMG